jgi:hypothetical protein
MELAGIGQMDDLSGFDHESEEFWFDENGIFSSKFSRNGLLC